MKKPVCQHSIADCINSRMNEGYRYRRYKCRTCGRRWSTVEVPVKNTRKGKVMGALGGLYEEIGLSPEQAQAIAHLIETFKHGR